MSRKIKYKILSTLPNPVVILILLCGGLLLSGCNEQAIGFALPEGDIEQGKATYMKLSCYECHSMAGIEWKPGSDSLKIPLGGSVSSLKTYGELVTSVINPSHKIAPGYKLETATGEDLSMMKNYNEVMTVQELVDLVSYLKSEYDLDLPTTNYYPYY